LVRKQRKLEVGSPQTRVVGGCAGVVDTQKKKNYIDEGRDKKFVRVDYYSWDYLGTGMAKRRRKKWEKNVAEEET